MEKKFTLMKTLSKGLLSETAFCRLLFPPSRKNLLAVNNDQTFRNDAKQYDASFLIFERTAIVDQPSVSDAGKGTSDQQKLKDKEELGKINDELALGSSPKPLYKNWKEKVNDDLAACSPIVIPMVIGTVPVVEARESVTVINDLKNILPTTTINDKTRTNKNGAWLPFASFSFLFVNALAKADLCQSIGQLFCNVAEVFKNQRPVLLPVPIRSRRAGKRNFTDGTKL